MLLCIYAKNYPKKTLKLLSLEEKSYLVIPMDQTYRDQLQRWWRQEEEWRSPSFWGNGGWVLHLLDGTWNLVGDWVGGNSSFLMKQSFKILAFFLLESLRTKLQEVKLVNDHDNLSCNPPTQGKDKFDFSIGRGGMWEAPFIVVGACSYMEKQCKRWEEINWKSLIIVM